MPLGLAKDSMQNLAELVSSKLEEDSNESASHQIPYDDLGTSIKPIGNSKYSEKEEQLAPPTSLKEVIAESNSSSLDAIPSQISPADNSKIQQYAGFSADYDDYTKYAYHASYSFNAESTISKQVTTTKSPWWQCFFLWCPPESYIEEDELNDAYDSPEDKKQKLNGDGQPPKIEDVDDEVSLISSESDVLLGSKLSQRDLEAVSERSRPDQPDETNTQDVKSEHGKRGIMKRSSAILSQSTRSNISNDSLASQKRRLLFPSYEEKTVTKKNLNVNFSPMARVVTIKSLKDMDLAEKSSIWWQKADYDEFRKTGRMVSKVMLQGGSEIWLATNQSWQLPNQGKAATLRHAMENIDSHDTRDKWWHKFGHSRRGLEHIASIDEGRQRQSNVKTSINAIVTEQKRQKVFHREDPDKLRMISIQNTSWAKDLAIASGASDADAVTKKFDDESRRSREFYLLKFSRPTPGADHNTSSSATKQPVPAFMKPMVSLKLQPNRLDANTTSRIKFRQKEKKAANHQRISSDLPTKRNEPIHDPKFHGPSERSLAYKGKLAIATRFSPASFNHLFSLLLSIFLTNK